MRLRVRTLPAGATLRMDGTPIANPFDAALARGGTHRLSASAQGYQDATEAVSLDRDRTVTLRLTPNVQARPEPAARRTPRQTRRPRPTQMRSRPSTMRASSMGGAGFVTDNPY